MPLYVNTVKAQRPAAQNQCHKVTPLFDTEYLRNGTRYRHSYNKVLHTPTKGFHFEISNYWEWHWVTAKYSVTRSIARRLCDSWASCTLVQ